MHVVGVDRRAERAAEINAGRCPIDADEPGLDELLAAMVHAGRLHAAADGETLAAADVVLVCVETPVNAQHVPEYEALRAACALIARCAQEGALVIVESTLAPGTMDSVVRPVLGGRFHLGHCPERVMPGKLLANLRTMSRVCGGETPEVAEAMRAFYRLVVEADLDAADCVTAELVKCAENAYRDVNIAFANLLALVCEDAGGDFLRVRELVNKSPGRNVLLAGGGVGGACIPKDTWLLASGAHDVGMTRMLSEARETNEWMPRHTAKLALRGLGAAGIRIARARVLVLGYAYLEDSDDARCSPSAEVADYLAGLGARVMIHDPFVGDYQGDVYVRAAGCDAAIVMTAHTAYRALDLGRLRAAMRTGVMVDARRVFTPEAARAAGFDYAAVGLGVRRITVPAMVTA